MSLLVLLIILLVVYQIKHFLADFPLQNAYMLRKFQEKDWALPLACHCGVHGFMTLCIVFLFSRSWILAAQMAVLDFVVHFTMDRIKASPKMLGRFKAQTKESYARLLDNIAIAGWGDERTVDGMCDLAQKKKAQEIHDKALKSNMFFWWSIGIDQMVHHFTHYVIIFWTVFYMIGFI